MYRLYAKGPKLPWKYRVFDDNSKTVQVKANIVSVRFGTFFANFGIYYIFLASKLSKLRPF